MHESQNPGAGVGNLSDSDLSAFLDHLSGMAYRCRWENDWMMEFVSRGSLALTGYAPEELLENGEASWSRLIHTGDLGDLSRRIRQALQDRKPFKMEYRHVSSRRARRG